MNLLRSMSKYLLIGVGQSYLLITGNIDLSIGSMVGMSAMISATLMAMGVNPFVAMAVAMACCLVTGVINGMLVGKFKLPPFIATLGTMFVTRGVAYMVNNNRNTDAIATGIGKEAGDKFQNVFYYGKTLGVYNTFWIALVIFLIFFFLLSKTRTGRHIYAIGSNVDAAKLSGVNVVNTTIKVHGSRKHVRDVRRCSRRYRRHLPARRNRTSARYIRRCGCMADTGEWSEHDRCTGRHPETCHRYHRCILCTS